MCLCIMAGVILTAAAASPTAPLTLSVERPPESSWKRTQCGGPSGSAEIPSKWASGVSAESTPLTAYPRPQMVRGIGANDVLRNTGDASTWLNLNGLWEWEKSSLGVPSFGTGLSGSILVPFPVESCLSGVAPATSAEVVMKMRYRLVFKGALGSRMLLHFGAVDWQATVYFNEKLLGNHTGGFDGFSFDITDLWKDENELIVDVYDPSDTGPQPNGKQRISAIDHPAGDQYTPSSGIWQTVWLEAVPSQYIKAVKIEQASDARVTVTTEIAPSAQEILEPVHYEVQDAGKVVASGTGLAGEAVKLQVPSAKLWSPDSPFLYDLVVSSGKDRVLSYFGLRTFALGNTSKGATRPLLNGKFTFMAGFLDQSWWPDGQYTAPTDAALEYDLMAAKMFGLNMIRLHQKINPERWYFHADRHGLLVLQDMVQKYGQASKATVPYFVSDMRAAIEGRGNHPCIVQFQTFNEGDCWRVFTEKPYDVQGIAELAKKLDPTRLVDTDSGGAANDYKYADVNDKHSYPYPGDPLPSKTQYAMVGEFGGIGAFIEGKEWVPGACHTYLKVNTSQEEASRYIEMAKTLESRVDHISASVYTQTTDVELECDGFLNYDRSNKFNEEQTRAIRDANQAIIRKGYTVAAEHEGFVEQSSYFLV